MGIDQNTISIEDSGALEEALRSTEEGQKFLKEFEQRIVDGVLSSVEDFVSAMRRREGYVYNADAQSQYSKGEATLDGDQALSLLKQFLEKITNTRKEIQSISRMAGERDVSGFDGVGDELEAIVVDTQKATESILDAVDAIEADLRDHELRTKCPEAYDSILHRCGSITTLCSFQDITGQRVQKVVEIIQMIDQQIGAIERNFAEPVRRDDRELTAREKEQKAGLLRGPQMPDQAISQEAIDAFFED